MKITCSSFKNQENLPVKYTCDGEGVIPELIWSDYSPETQSFALIVEDPDAPMGTYVHFLAIDIPINISSSIAIPQTQIIPNTSGKTSYIPACPPSGSHRYIFKVFALNVEKIDGINKDNFYQKIKTYILDQSQITALYSRDH